MHPGSVPDPGNAPDPRQIRYMAEELIWKLKQRYELLTYIRAVE